MCHGGDGGAGGGESLWPGASAAWVLRGEVVLLQRFGGSDRRCGLILGASDGRLGLGLGGFPLKEVVGHFEGVEHVFLMGSWRLQW